MPRRGTEKGVNSQRMRHVLAMMVWRDLRATLPWRARHAGGPLMQAMQGAASAAIIAMGLWTAFLAGTPPDAAAETRARRLDAACAPERFKIVLDVGHTVENQGATSARGVKEYVFNLRLAKEMEKALIDAGFRQTHLFVTPGPTKAQLFKRVGRANALGTDLFISVHHNDVQERYKEKWEHEGESRPYSDRFAGHSLFVSRKNPRLAESLAFGHLLGIELKKQGLVYTRHHLENVPGERRQLLDPEGGVYRYDNLVVLRYTGVPAVLMEAGIIINRAEELLLETPEHRDRIAQATLAAVDQFCAKQQGRPAARRTVRSKT
jgi:N-acetylmuramoyl-L-alanine amidase